MATKPLKDLPGKTVERLSQYRRLLYNIYDQSKHHVFSHELAALMNLTAVQVRRDLMLIGHTGSQSKGYNVKGLMLLIGRIIDSEAGQKVAIAGLGNLGKAIMSYFAGKREKLSIVAGFDNDPQKTDRNIAGVPCYHINKIQEVIQRENISIVILTVAPEAAHDVAKLFLEAGVKGILNYTSVPLTLPQNVHLEEYDIVTSLEKLAFLVKH